MSDTTHSRGPADDAAAATGRPETSSLRIILTLGVAGVMAGLLLVFVFQATQPTILAYKAKMLKLAVEEVLQGPDSYLTLYLVDGALTAELLAGSEEDAYEQIYMGLDAAGKVTGIAAAHSRPGFQEHVKVIFGFDPSDGRMMGMKVLESKETPGLGDKIEKDEEFVAQFTRALAPLEAVKKGRGDGDPHQVDIITGATISSRCVVDVINEAYARWNPLVEQMQGATRP